MTHARSFKLLSVLVIWALLFAPLASGAQAAPRLLASAQASADSADESTVAISGQVVSPAGPVGAGLRVQLRHAGGDAVAEVLTDEAGRFTFPPQPHAAYVLNVSTVEGIPLRLELDGSTVIEPGEGHTAVERTLRLVDAPPAPGIGDPDTQPAPLAAEATPEPLPFVIYGQVTDLRGPATGVTVQLWRGDWETLMAEARTDETGRYAFEAAPADHYRLNVMEADGEPLPIERTGAEDIAPNAEGPNIERNLRLAVVVSAANAPTAKPFPEAAPTESPTQPPNGVEAIGSITGLVTALDTALPLSSVTVRAYYSGTSTLAGTATTAASGLYTITALGTGSYQIWFDIASTRYVDEWYNNQIDQSAASPVRVVNGLPTQNINAALDVGGIITGTVTGLDTSLPLAGYGAYAYGTSYGSTSTNAFGQYTITGLLAGPYQVQFTTAFSSIYVDEYYNNRVGAFSGDIITVALNNTYPNINAALDVGGRITGTVTTADTGLPLSNVYVTLYNSGGSSQTAQYTNASGLYDFRQLLAGGYKIGFTPPAPYVEEFYSNHYGLSAIGAADLITVALNTPPTTDINAVMDVGGKITGTVTASDTGNPLASIGAYLYDSNNNYIDYTTTLASTGAYTFTSLIADNYRILFDVTTPGSKYVDEYYTEQFTLASATPIAVAMNSTTGNINGVLNVGGRITGRAISADTALPVSGVSVYIYNSNGNFVNSQVTNVSGEYTTTYLTADNYRLYFVPVSGYQWEYYNNKYTLASADPVAVAFGGLVQNVNVTLESTGKILGQVTAADTGLPLNDVDVFVYNAQYNYSQGTTTDASGNYTITNLLPDTYRVEFYPSYSSVPLTQEYLAEWYDNQASFSTATPISISVGNFVQIVNVSLDRTGRLSGQVTDGSAPLEGAVVSLYQPGYSYSYDYQLTNASGVYTFTTLTPNALPYRIEFAPPSGLNLQREFYSNAVSLASATPILVAPNSLQTNINAALDAGGFITGVITAADTGLPFSDVTVRAYDLSTDALAGTAVASLPPNYAYTGPEIDIPDTPASGITFTVYVSDTGTIADVNVRVDITHYDADNLQLTLISPSGTPLDLSSNNGGCCADDYRNVIFDDGAAAPITAAPSSGIITGPYRPEAPLSTLNGQSLNGLWKLWVKDTACCGTGSLDAFSLDILPLAGVVSSTYTLAGLPAGAYRVEFAPTASSGYLTEYYNDKSYGAIADPVNVTVGAVTPDINASLEPSGRLTGTVTAANNAQPLEDVYVALVNADGYTIANTSTNASGVYSITTNLYTGLYRLWFDPQYYYNPITQQYAREYYDGQRQYQTAALIAITSGLTTTINPTLDLLSALTGTVTAEDTGAPLADVEVYAYDSAGGYAGYNITDSAGSYLITELEPDTYRLYFNTSYSSSALTLEYASAYYDHKPTLSAATPITVAAGITLTQNTTLVRLGRITGQVTDALTGLPVASAIVRAYDTSGYAVGSAVQTDASGVYTLTALPPSNYRVEFRSPANRNYAREYYNNQPRLAVADMIGVPLVTLVTGINAALDAGGMITGQVTAEGSGLPLAGRSVQLYDAGGASVASTNTDASGVYTFTQLLPGSYRAYFLGGSGYYAEYYNNQSTLAASTLVAAPAGGLTPNINAALAPAAQIIGRVTSAASGLPIASATIGVYRDTGSLVTSASTNASGAYTATSLAAGNYVVQFSRASYATEYYTNTYTFDQAQVLNVLSGTLTSNIDAALEAGAALTGTIRAADTGQPLYGSYAYLYDVNGDAVTSYFASTNGQYSFSNLGPGEYRVGFDVSSYYFPSYRDEYYSEALSLNAATPITLTAGQVFTNVNGLIDPYNTGRISGLVTAEDTGLPVSGVTVKAYRQNGTEVAQELNASYSFTPITTDASGVYVFPRLITDTYRLQFIPPANSIYATEFYSDRAALAFGDSLSITYASVITNVNAALSVGGTITGVVTAEAGGPLAGVTVNLYDQYGGAVMNTATNASGAYQFKGVMPGAYVVRFDPLGNYLSEYWDNQSHFNAATLITVTAGQVTPNINAALALGGDIHGLVTAGNTGALLGYVYVYVYDALGNFLDGQLTNLVDAGAYAVNQLSPSNGYRVWFAPYSQSDYASEYYDNQPYFGAATPVVVTSGNGTEINAALDMGGHVTGQVSAADTGFWLSNVYVTLYDCNKSSIATDFTDSNGVYEFMGVRPGTYYVGFDPNQSTSSASWAYLPEYHSNQASLSAAASFGVAAGQVVSVDAALERGGQISGQVTDEATGLGLSSVSVWVYPATEGNFLRSFTANSNGTYTTHGLPIGSYRLYFGRSGYVGEYYDNHSTLGAANLIPVAAPTVTGGVNAVLTRTVPSAAIIMGRVTAADTGAPLFDADVYAYNSSNTLVRNASTNLNGDYTLSGLSADTYTVTVLTRFSAYGFTTDYAPQSLSNVIVISDTAATTANFTLARGGRIAGRVTAADTGLPLASAYVTFYDSNGRYVDYDFTDAAGYYLSPALAPGNYRVRVADFSVTQRLSCSQTNTLQYAGEYYDDVATLGEATPVTVNAGATSGGINVALGFGGGAGGYRVYLPLIQR